jgi:serine/threonine-protein kinase
MDPRPLAPEPPPRTNVMVIVGLTILAVGALAGIVVASRTTPAQEVRQLLEDGKSREAFDRLKVEIKENDKRSDATLLTLLAVTMHQLDQHRDEEKVFRDEIAPKAPELLDGFVLGGLLEDLGKKEDGAPRELLKRIPKEPLYAVLTPIVVGDASPRQWGALRYLDLEGAASELDLVKLYVGALGSPTCAVKKVAAKRLGQLGDKFAEEPLTRLKAEPKRDEPCGQVEAGLALAVLAKKKAE